MEIIHVGYRKSRWVVWSGTGGETAADGGAA